MKIIITMFLQCITLLIAFPTIITSIIMVGTFNIIIHKDSKLKLTMYFDDKDENGIIDYLKSIIIVIVVPIINILIISFLLLFSPIFLIIKLFK